MGGSELADPQASIRSEGFVPRELIGGNRSVGALFELADPREALRGGLSVGADLRSSWCSDVGFGKLRGWLLSGFHCGLGRGSGRVGRTEEAERKWADPGRLIREGRMKRGRSEGSSGWGPKWAYPTGPFRVGLSRELVRVGSQVSNVE